MRDIMDYERKITGKNVSFERCQEHYRRKLVKKVINKYAWPGCSILEIGCGLRPLFVDYQDEYDFTVVEPAEHFYKNAKALARNYRNVMCYQGFFENIVSDMKECTFDIIICASLLQEVEDPKKILYSIKCLCNHQTVIHVNVANANSLHRLLAKEMGLIEDVHQFSELNYLFQQHRVFDMQSLKEMVENENFQIVDEGSCFLKPFTQKQMYLCVEEKILNSDILDALDSICSSYMKEFGSEIYLNMRMKR